MRTVSELCPDATGVQRFPLWVEAEGATAPPATKLAWLWKQMLVAV